MLEIKCNFSDITVVDAKNADETALRYYLFLGSVILKKGDHVINIDWDWIPVFDFALCLVAISDTLQNKLLGHEEFEFTESNEKLIFEKENDKIKITASFSDEYLETTFDDFQESCKNFYKHVILDILNKNPGLKDNNTFKNYLKPLKINH